ncbi:hypothetical protein [Methanococcoides methylutens]|uniref:Rubrerythrin diiron-binding domain-containing protein n=1 Tax=Methanococcoides methylutens MM1 TaxID=1434104 RepID=A0A0E3ST80_METMT|nr:hypothetical protein [Methanococcoides methylutens]AKB85762.1 hypothetical protein MCMEM_1709 [Methanococcoides methylutens MM1]
MEKINQKEILALTLQRMYWIETEMEQLVTWEARIELEGEHKEALEILSNDSDKHALILEKWLNIANIELPRSAPRGIPQKGFDFYRTNVFEMFSEIRKYEILARNTYHSITSAEPKVLEETFPDEEQRGEFIKDMKHLVAEEERHKRICDDKIGGFTRVL